MFQPWRGADYGCADNAIGGVRLLVLGESHYSTSESYPVGSTDPEATQWVVNAYLDGSLKSSAKAFFTKIASVVACKPSTSISSAERSAIWNSIAFYNYVPVFAATGPAQAIPEHMWHGRAPEAFQDVLRTLEVEAVLACGERLWWKMPDGLGKGPTFEADGKPVYSRRYSTWGDFEAPATYMHHPSSANGWSVERWKNSTRFLFDRVREDRARFYPNQPELVQHVPTA